PNVVSERNIDIIVQGPVTVKAGEELNLQIGITNKNTTALDQVELTSIWPAGTKDSNSGIQDLVFQTQKIGQIASGETVNVAGKGVIFGKENDELEIKLTLRYHLAGSNNLFVKELSYRLKVTASPIDLSVVIPPEVNSNQEFMIEIKAVANSDKPVSNVMMEVVFPSGFQLKSADIPPGDGGNKWLLGDLAPNAQRTIKLKGVIEGQSEQLRAFEFRLGAAADKQSQVISFLYNDLFKSLTIKRPFLGLEFIEQANAGADNLTQRSGQTYKYGIGWSNNLSGAVEDVLVKGVISGNAVNKSTIDAPEGYYSSGDNRLTWDKNTYKTFKSIEPGQSGSLGLVMSPAPLVSAGQTIKNPVINLVLNISGTRVSEGFARERVETDITRTIKVDSLVSLSALSEYHTGPFSNSGPIPPKVEKATTYTIEWKMTNSSNDLKDIAVEGTIPLGVSWVGLTSPGTENVSFDEKTRRIRWDVGEVKAGTGIESPVRNAFFQLKLVPSANQVGKSPVLVENTSLQGLDTWSGSSVEIRADVITTAVKGDSSFRPGDDLVER
ncbi:MAG: hypothetical protein NTY66_04325, partial [Candidatus Vogelbacteria bacterium]|nr:hypothetical protein [Candidatus Vogelbacteria bacterium]